jgi:3-hydroxyacyl-[acyl-carrier-protein] dehydratase
VSSKNLILDFSAFDLDRILADSEEIRRYNPQRFEMEQLTAIVYDD